MAPGLTVVIQTAIAAPIFVLLPIAVGYQNELQGGVWGEILFTPLGAKNISLWNHAPSLHVAYAFTLALTVGKKFGTSAMAIGLTWATAVSLSTMLVHEHHLICVITGFILFVVTISTVYPWLQRKRT